MINFIMNSPALHAGGFFVFAGLVAYLRQQTSRCKKKTAKTQSDCFKRVQSILEG